ncbi:hypothetical protein KUTeg_003589 [Tegillarca granosa]|uniref:Essential MCU regulator, mitochondrial n=1 Tax=Tegillarca granosa TaxID=220873 RepID=A0ABQ9FMK0_TEGGR|nr:hypothetical protein KUTeg_003589 [Tegillarca granosa]
MASNIFRLCSSLKTQILSTAKTQTTQQVIQKRTLTCKETGAFLPEPEVTKLPVIKVLAMVFPFLYAGATVAKECAAFLEDNDIFITEEHFHLCKDNN